MQRMGFLGIAILITFACVQAAPIDHESRPRSTKLEQSPHLFEGDMYFPTSARGVVQRGNSVAWPDGIVPYEISSGFGVIHQNTIVTAMRTLESLVAVNNRKCILFRPRIDTDQYYVTFENLDGCYSFVGQNTGTVMNRTISLQAPGCIYVGTIMHELLHVLGFFHEQSRPDRDSYVRINYSNIEEGMEGNFNKFTTTVVDTQNTPYDYGSVMHYSNTTFSKNGLATIEPLQANVVIGQRDTLSPIDIQEVQLFYRCNGTGPTLAPTTTPATITTGYSTQLTSSSPVYAPPVSTGNCYYSAVQVSVPVTGVYYLQSSSVLDTIGYLYNNSFNSSNPKANLLMGDDDSGGNSQFKLTVGVRPTDRLILVATTYKPGITGIINITATGPANAKFGSGSSFSSTDSNIVNSNYANQLTTTSSKFARPSGGTAANYFYQAILVDITTAGSYTFNCSSGMDTYGIMYSTAFNPAQSAANVLLQNDDGAGNRQFQLVANPTSAAQYILVATTYYANITGPFLIMASGPAQVTFTPQSK